MAIMWIPWNYGTKSEGTMNVEKLAILSFGEADDEKMKIILLDRNTHKAALRVKRITEQQGDFYSQLKNAEVDRLTESLKEVLQNKKIQGRFCYVTLPDSLIIYKCFKRSLETLPNFKKPEEKESFQKLCLKENPDKKPLDNYQVAIMGVTELDNFAYINCAYVLRATIQALQVAFARNKTAVFAIEPNFYGLRRILRLKFPTQPCIFSQEGNYFWTNEENIFSLTTGEQDETTNYQVLMAMRQKIFAQQVPWDQVMVVKKENLQLLPAWIDTEDAEKDYLTLCALGSGLRGVESLGKNEGGKYGLQRLRQLLNR
jgi:hypothetical protein